MSRKRRGNKRYDLYDKLIKRSKKVKIDNKKRNIIISTLSQLDISHSNVIFCLIYHHASINGEKMKNHRPYGSKMVTKFGGVIFDYDNLPEELMKVIYLYITDRSSQ